MPGLDLVKEQAFRSDRHVESLLGKFEEDKMTVAYWEPRQVSSYHRSGGILWGSRS
jgi:hypothetical protein